MNLGKIDRIGRQIGSGRTIPGLRDTKGSILKMFIIIIIIPFSRLDRTGHGAHATGLWRPPPLTSGSEERAATGGDVGDGFKTPANSARRPRRLPGGKSATGEYRSFLLPLGLGLDGGGRRGAR
jgi:hypothetical protein